MLYKKQAEILSQIKPKGLLPLGTSTGKTIISLIYYLNNFYPLKLYIITPAAKKDEGGWDREIAIIKQKYNVNFEYEVHSYSKLTGIFDKGFYILDEAHYIKNPTSQRSKNINKILNSYAESFILLTATPGSKIEEYAHYFVLWGQAKNKTHFYNQFCVMQTNNKYYNRSFMEIIDYKNLDLFNVVLKYYSTDKLTVDDIAELPERIEKKVEFKKSKIYDQIKKDRVIKVYDKNILLDTQAKLCSYLRQYCNVDNKLNYLKYIVDEIKETQENLLIFYNFKTELENIQKIIKIDYIVNGSVKEYPKKNSFKTQKGTVTAVQIQSGGTGVEFTYCNKVVYYSPTYSYQDYEQSLGRAYRIGQSKKLIIYKFTTIDTIEQEVWKSLENKQDFNEKLWK